MSIAIACKILSRLGGALSRSPKERPGADTMMRGLTRFRDILAGFMLSHSGSASFFRQRFMGHAQA